MMSWQEGGSQLSGESPHPTDSTDIPTDSKHIPELDGITTNSTAGDPFQSDSIQSQTKDITSEIALSSSSQEEKTEDTPKVKTAEFLENFKDPMDRTTTLMLNLVLERAARNAQVEWNKEDGIQLEEIQALGWTDAVIKTVDYYLPYLPLDHPLFGLAIAGIGMSGLVYAKATTIRDRVEAKTEDAL